MALFKLGKDLDGSTVAYIESRTYRLPRETHLPGTTYRQVGRVYPSCDEPRFGFKAWVRKRLNLKPR